MIHNRVAGGVSPVSLEQLEKVAACMAVNYRSIYLSLASYNFSLTLTSSISPSFRAQGWVARHELWRKAIFRSASVTSTRDKLFKQFHPLPEHSLFLSLHSLTYTHSMFRPATALARSLRRQPAAMPLLQVTNQMGGVMKVMAFPAFQSRSPL